jgi:putative transposase
MRKELPHQADLRKGRVSIPRICYFITTNVQDRHPLITPDAAEIIIASLKWLRDCNRIWLLGYTVMDNHLHFLMVLRAPHTLEEVLHSLKRHTAREINKLTGREGNFWQPGYHDHAIRDEADFWLRFHYMHNNPVRRGLVEQPENYLFSTAHPSRIDDVDWDILGDVGWIVSDQPG